MLPACKLAPNPATMATQVTDTPDSSKLGLIQALTACMFWGLMPVYFKFLQSVAPIEVVAHRVIWSVPLLLFILWLRKNLGGLKETFGDPKLLRLLLLSSILIAANWLIYVWAVHDSHILAASLGYFISPLLSVFFGHIFLKERLTRYQWLAVAIAAAGVSVLALEAWQTLWISLILAGSWSSYALVRKIAVTGPIVGLTVETGLLAPLFLAFLLWVTYGGGMAGGDMTNVAETAHLGSSTLITILLMGGAIVTAVPLMLFASAVKKMSLGAIGLLLYIAPTIQFFIGVFIYHEPLTTSHLICFALIWTSLAIFSADSIITERRRKAAVIPA